MNPRPASSLDPRYSPPGRRQDGVGLIEVLVSVFILSIAALGIGLMQVRALANNNSSMARSMAVVMSYSIIEAMRVDSVAAAAGSYDGSVTADSCPTASTTLAQTQLRDWCTQLGQVLGQRATTIGTIDCNGAFCTVSVQFDDSRMGNIVSSGAAASAGGTTAQLVTTQSLL